MKSVLLYANRDPGLESRFQAALDVTRLFGGHLTCLQVTPYDSFIMGDPFGGVYALPTVIEQVQKAAGTHREEVEGRLRGEGISWDWLPFDGAPGQLIVDRARLCDLIVLSRPEQEGAQGQVAQSIAAEVLVHARSPVLAVPPASRGIDALGAAMVAWDGSLEASHALRLTLPMLLKASAVNIVTVTEGQREFPATDAARYLARHGVEPELLEWPAEGRSTAAALGAAATSLSAAYVVMGAYGHTRLREAFLGGATRDMLRDAPVPLLMAH
ncbi:universal stress protein [Sphingosinicella sp. CPCC 101087]|uniref:universal stress protein n=1 Tax=Sphingosinicella sp. CPCC 101087 TaxID=2497754 RepID=UPI0013EA54D5|nr:universal stress protein [Sphingosinicella sp. CPCC 101087]